MRPGSSGSSDVWGEAIGGLARLVESLEAAGAPSPTATHTAQVTALVERVAALGDGHFVCASVTRRRVFPLLALPEALVAEVLSHLCGKDLARSASVSRAWYAQHEAAAVLRCARLGSSRLPARLPCESASAALRFVEATARRAPLAIASGSAHSMCIAPSGTAVLSWGGDSLGERAFRGHLGQGTLYGSPVAEPAAVAGPVGTRAREVAARGYSCMLLTDDGRVYNWGWNEDGRLGHADGGGVIMKECLARPTQLAALGGVRVVQVACGERHGLALSDAGELWSWGNQTHGQLGRGDDGGAGGALPPGRVAFASGVRILEASAGGLHSLAVGAAGELYSWGAGRDGKLGHGDAAQQPRPRRVGGALGSRRCTHCSAGDGHSLVVADGGQLFSFGLGDFGRLGHGDERSRHAPECVRALRGLAVVQASAGFYHSAVVVRGGQVYAFGDGAFGKLAAGSTEDQLLPVRMQLAIGWSGVEIAEVAAGYQHTAIRTSAGVVLTCGIGWKGQLGCGDLREDQRVPIAVCRSLDTPPLQLRYASVLQRWGAASGTPGGSPTGVRSAAPPRLAPGGYHAIGLGLAPHDDW